MKKVFLFEKHVKTSEDCKKNSKSVSYETLVGGTTTVSSAYEQTQCLSKCSAGYRFCKTMRFSYENLVDRLLQTSPVFRLVKILTLAAVFAMGTLSESWAAVDSGTCGNGCNWSYNTETKELTLSGNGMMDNYWNNRPWQTYLTQIETVKVASGSTLSNIGERAFYGATSLVSVELPNVTNIGDDAFAGATNLVSADMPNVTFIGRAAFFEATSLTSVNVPNVSYIGSGGFQYTALESIDMPNVTDLNCGAFDGIRHLSYIGYDERKMRDNCQALPDIGDCSTDSSGYITCGSCGEQFIKSGEGCVSSCGLGYLAKRGLKNICIDENEGCGDWYAEDEGECVPDYQTDEAGNIIIDDDSPEITEDVFGLSSGMPEKILCRGDVAKCKELLRNYPIYSGGGNPYGYGSSDYYPGYSAPYGGEYLNVDLGDYVTPATETNCESSRYYWSGSTCNNKSGGINCDENFKQMETWCNRIRYTPADAAKVLKDTDNEIVMTFKVNR